MILLRPSSLNTYSSSSHTFPSNNFKVEQEKEKEKENIEKWKIICINSSFLLSYNSNTIYLFGRLPSLQLIASLSLSDKIIHQIIQNNKLKIICLFTSGGMFVLSVPELTVLSSSELDCGGGQLPKKIVYSDLTVYVLIGKNSLFEWKWTVDMSPEPFKSEEHEHEEMDILDIHLTENQKLIIISKEKEKNNVEIDNLSKKLLSLSLSTSISLKKQPIASFNPANNLLAFFSDNILSFFYVSVSTSFSEEKSYNLIRKCKCFDRKYSKSNVKLMKWHQNLNFVAVLSAAATEGESESGQHCLTIASPFYGILTVINNFNINMDMDICDFTFDWQSDSVIYFLSSSSKVRSPPQIHSLQFTKFLWLSHLTDSFITFSPHEIRIYSSNTDFLSITHSNSRSTAGHVAISADKSLVGISHDEGFSIYNCKTLKPKIFSLSANGSNTFYSLISPLFFHKSFIIAVVKNCDTNLYFLSIYESNNSSFIANNNSSPLFSMQIPPIVCCNFNEPILTVVCDDGIVRLFVSRTNRHNQQELALLKSIDFGGTIFKNDKIHSISYISIYPCLYLWDYTGDPMFIVLADGTLTLIVSTASGIEVIGLGTGICSFWIIEDSELTSSHDILLIASSSAQDSLQIWINPDLSRCFVDRSIFLPFILPTITAKFELPIIGINWKEGLAFGSEKNFGGVSASGINGGHQTNIETFLLFSHFVKYLAEFQPTRLIGFLGRLKGNPMEAAFLEHSLHLMLESTATDVDQGCKYFEKFIEYLRSKSSFLFLSIISNVARKSDIAEWKNLFDAAGSPRDLFQECLMEGLLDIASNYLVILENRDDTSLSEFLYYSGQLLESAFKANNCKLISSITTFLLASHTNSPDSVASLTRRASAGNQLGFPVILNGIEETIVRNCVELIKNYRIISLLQLAKAINIPLKILSTLTAMENFNLERAVAVLVVELEWPLPDEMTIESIQSLANLDLDFDGDTQQKQLPVVKYSTPIDLAAAIRNLLEIRKILPEWNVPISILLADFKTLKEIFVNDGEMKTVVRNILQEFGCSGYAKLLYTLEEQIINST